MYNVILENENGEQLDLMQHKDMKCVHIEGISSITATINETENASMDGSIINSERIDSRPINLTVRILDNFGDCRALIYKHAVIKKKVKLTLVNNIRSVYIEGKVKNIDGDPFTQNQQIIITILCPEPYFNELMGIEEEFSNIIKMLHFPLAIEAKGIPFGVITDIKQIEIVNIGEADTGLEFTLRALGEVENPRLVNMKTGEYLALEYTMQSNEVIKISTIDKNKYVISIYHDQTTNIIGSLDLSSEWLKANVGVSHFTYVADRGSNYLEVSALFKNKYIGM